MTTQPTSQKKPGTRNRAATEQSILDAFEAMLLDHGVQGVGVNALAQRAGVNKTLIYRYFGDLAGVATAYGASSDFWPTELEMIGEDPEAFAALSVNDRITVVLCNYVRALRRRPATIEVLAGELLSPTDVSRALEAAAAGPGIGVGKYIMGDDGDSHPTDMAVRLTFMVNSMAAYLCIRERSSPDYMGRDLSNDMSWEYIEESVRLMADAMLNNIS